MRQSQDRLVPAQATQFPGSFASEFRTDHRKLPQSNQWQAVLHTFFLEGWQDISVYKSAVSTIFLSDLYQQTEYEKCMVYPAIADFSSCLVHRIRWHDFAMLYLLHDRHHSAQHGHTASRRLCRDQQYHSRNALHIRTCALLWGPCKSYDHVSNNLDGVDTLSSWGAVPGWSDLRRGFGWRFDQRQFGA